MTRKTLAFATCAVCQRQFIDDRPSRILCAGYRPLANCCSSTCSGIARERRMRTDAVQWLKGLP